MGARLDIRTVETANGVTLRLGKAAGRRQEGRRRPDRTLASSPPYGSYTSAHPSLPRARVRRTRDLGCTAVPVAGLQEWALSG